MQVTFFLNNFDPESDDHYSHQLKARVIFKTNNMKKLLFGSVILMIIFSCGKSGRDISYGPDKVDALFRQLKDDTSYAALYQLISSTSEIMMVNSKKSGKTDTAVLNNMELSLKEKYERLNYSDYNTVENNSMRMYALMNTISAKYPGFKTLTEAENKKLISLSKKYYKKLNKQ